MDLQFENVEVFIVENGNLVKSKQYALENKFMGNVYFVSLPPEIKQSPEKMKKHLLMKQMIYEELVRFKDTLKEKMPHFNLSSFYQNFKNIKIEHRLDKRSKKRKELTGIRGGYFPDKNKLLIFDDELKLVLPHELFHMSTSLTDDNGVLYCGFHQINPRTNSEIGRSINEGYTTLLANRYFQIDTKSAYELFVKIMKIIEEEIGQEKMETMYSENNLHGLLKQVEEQGFLDSFTNIIKYTDYLNAYYTEKIDPLRDFKPAYEKLSEEQREQKYLEIDQQKTEVEELLMKSIETFLVAIAKNKISRKEITFDDARNWAMSNYKAVDALKSGLSLNYTIRDAVNFCKGLSGISDISEKLDELTSNLPKR